MHNQKEHIDMDMENYKPNYNDWNLIICDSESHIVKMIQRNVGGLCFGKVTLCYDGQQLLAEIEKIDKPDRTIVVTEIRLSGIDGFEVLKQIRSSPNLKDMPVIFLTCLSQDCDVFKAWSLGVTCHLSKPYNPKELESFLSKIVESFE